MFCLSQNVLLCVFLSIQIFVMMLEQLGGRTWLICHLLLKVGFELV